MLRKIIRKYHNKSFSFLKCVNQPDNLIVFSCFNTNKVFVYVPLPQSLCSSKAVRQDQKKMQYLYSPYYNNRYIKEI